MSSAIPLAEQEGCAFGVVPTEAHTGYGYIKRGKSQGAGFR